jgi:hypothetical protein
MRLLTISFISLALFASGGTAASALEDAAPETATWNQAWNAEHMDARCYQAFAAPKASLFQRTEFWSSGVARPSATPVAPLSQKTVGARLRPFADYDLHFGTEMSRSLDSAHDLNAKVDWQLAWSRQWNGEALEFALTTSGAVDRVSTTYSQSAGGSVGVRLPSTALPWETRIVVTPSVNLDTATGLWNPNLRSEIVAKRVLTSHRSPIESVVDIRMGYDVAPDAQPAASATVQLSFSPRI